MRIFLSVGEPSGDLHGANLIRALRERRPDVECLGFGGEHMEAAGCQLHFPLASLAVTGFTRIFASMHKFVDLIGKTDRFFRHHRPDAVVLIDFPGFNWWIARRAHFHRIPVFYFVPPQLWAWAGWRIRKMQRFVDHVICTLPFEQPWYAERGVQAHYVGHPYFDELRAQPFDTDFVARQRVQGGPIVALLPGSRTQEVEMNTSTLLRTAERVHAERPDVRFLVAAYKPHQAAWIEQRLHRHPQPYVEVCVRKTPEIIRAAHSCVAVSGSVSLELLYQTLPTVVLYRIAGWETYLDRTFRTCPYISLVNLLANRQLYPEFLTTRNEGDAIAQHLLGWMRDETTHAHLREELCQLREQVARPGACDRAADYVLAALQTRRTRLQAA